MNELDKAAAEMLSQCDSVLADILREWISKGIHPHQIAVFTERLGIHHSITALIKSAGYYYEKVIANG